jgi:N-acetylmuramoyl-L-alanine amidase
MELLSLFNMAALCLSLNVYNEARTEPIQGQYAVAFVTMNRVKQSKEGVCQVVFKRKQFSWTNNAFDENGKMKQRYLPISGKQWDRARKIASQVIRGEVVDFTRNATYFFADYIKAPRWASEKRYVGKWGVHLFFREAIQRRRTRTILAATARSQRSRLASVSSVHLASYSGRVQKRSQSLYMQRVPLSADQTLLAYSRKPLTSWIASVQPPQMDLGWSALSLWKPDQYQCEEQNLVLIA